LWLVSRLALRLASRRERRALRAASRAAPHLRDLREGVVAKGEELLEAVFGPLAHEIGQQIGAGHLRAVELLEDVQVLAHVPADGSAREGRRGREGARRARERAGVDHFKSGGHREIEKG
jgi:hypothetical protein